MTKTGHETTARGMIAYISDEAQDTTVRIYMEREDDGTYTVACNMVNGRGAVVMAESTHTHLSEEEARTFARAAWYRHRNG